MRGPSSFVFASGLVAAVAASAPAEPAGRDARFDIRVERAQGGVVAPREEGFGRQFVSVRDELENFPLNTPFGAPGVSAAPTSFTGPAGFDWPLNTIVGQGDGPQMNPWVRIIDLSAAPVGGPNGVTNASKALRIRTIVPQTPGQFFFGARLGFGAGTEAAPFLALDPIPGVNARASAEFYLTTIDQTFTFEPVSTRTGFVTGRLMWGGECVDNAPGQCAALGLPTGLLTHMVALTRPPGIFESAFVPARYCTTFFGDPIPGCLPHPGFQIGDMVPPPVGSWTRFASETTADGRILFMLDLLDGSPEAIIFDNLAMDTTLIDGVAVNSSFEHPDAEVLIDNIEATGPLFGVGKPPALECPYNDDLEWLVEGQLRAQSSRWWVAQPAFTVVIPDESGQVIQQGNAGISTNRYRRELATEVPGSAASVSNDVIVSVRASITSGTVRGFALFDGEDLAARLFVGRETNATPFEPGVYAQIDPGYDPIDDPQGEDPFANAPVVGEDVADTGFDWTGLAFYRDLELRLSANGALRVSVDGQRIYAGPGAFLASADAFAFESENNALGQGATLRIDDVAVVCDAPSCAADFDLDDAITFSDLNAVLANFGATGLTGFNPGDANGDGIVNFADLNAVLSAYGQSCE